VENIIQGQHDANQIIMSLSFVLECCNFLTFKTWWFITRRDWMMNQTEMTC